MSSYRFRARALLAAALMSLTAATAAQAATVQQRDLLGLGGVIGGILSGLTSVLNGLLGASQIQTLNTLTTTVTNGGTAPSAQTLAPLTTLVSGVSTGAGVPTDVKTQATTVLALLDGSSTPLSSGSIGQITGLLGTLALTQGLSATQVGALDGLVAALQAAVGSATGGLPVVGGVTGGGGALGSTLLAPLTGLEGTLTGGATPTGALLSPVTALLREVAGAVPNPLSATLTELADAVDANTGTLGDELLTPLHTLLGQIAGTAGVDGPVQIVVGTLSGLLTPSSGGGTPTGGGGTPTGGGTPAGPGTYPVNNKPVGKAKVILNAARIRSVKADRKRGRLIVSLSCAAGTRYCASILSPMKGSQLAGTSALVVIAPGKTSKQTLKLTSRVRKILKRRSVKFTVVGYSQNGKLAQKSLTVKVPAAASSAKKKR